MAAGAACTEDRIKHPVRTERATALVDADCIVGIPQRVDYKGAQIQPLDEAAVEEALVRLLDTKGVEAIAVCFLWSFYNDADEQAVKRILQRVAPGVYCSLSSEIAPVPGEYERTSTTVINAYAGRMAKDYLKSLEALLRRRRATTVRSW